MEVLIAVREHYVRHWGEPSREAEFTTRDDRIEVLKWDASTTTEGVTVYATLGGSATSLPGLGERHRIEYVLVLEPGRDDVAQELAGLGLYARTLGVTIDHGHTVPADGPLWPGTSMATFLVLRPFVEIVPALRLGPDLHVDFLQAVPVFEQERRFKNQHSAEALLERWEEARVPFWDPRRSAEPAV